MSWVRLSFHCFQLFLLLCIAWFPANAQEPVHYNLNDENGLPSNEIYQVLQDRQGFVWIGCDAGLFKYDGFEYKRYKNDDQNARAISDLKLDVKGRLWSRNFNGEIYCVINDKLQLVTKNFKTNVAHAEYDLDKKGNCWGVFNSTVYSISADGKILFQQKIKLKNKSISSTNDVALHKGRLYMTDRSNSIFAFTIRSKQLQEVKKTHAPIERNTFFWKNNQLMVLSEITTANSISLLAIKDFTTKIIQQIKLTAKNPRLYAICETGIDQAWICSANGIGNYSRSLQSLDGLDSFFKGKNCSNVLLDREGNYWFSTLQNGIYIVPDRSIQKIDNTNFSLPENNVTALKALNRNELLLGSFSGHVYKINLKTKDVSALNGFTTIKTVSVKFIHSFGDNFMISHGPLSQINQSKLLESYPIYNAKDASLIGDSLYFLLSELHSSVHKRELKPTVRFISKAGGGRNLIYNQADQTIYYAFSSGLFAWKNGRFKEIKIQNESIYVASLSVQNGNVLVASLANGLLVIKNGVITETYSSKNTIIEDELRMVHSNSRYIWISSNSYLYRITIKTNEIAPFSNLNGINPRDINAIESNGGRLFLATNKGLIYFPETLSWKNVRPPLIYINYVVVEGKVKEDLRSLVLPFNNHTFKVDLSSVSFKSRGKYSYRYRLVGLNDSWISIPSNNRQITMNHLPSGSFRFEVQAVNENGVRSKTVSFPLRIEPALWETWWFYLLSAIFFILVIAFIFYSRLKYLKRKADLKNKLVLSQLTALKSQMNPHFMFNALNSIQDLMLHKDTKGSNLYISKFSNLMRKVLNASDQETITLQEEIEILSLYLDLEKLRFGNEFTFELEVDPLLDPYSITLPSMILQPFVENALKHGLLHKKGEKKLRIHFLMNEQLICEISDNGIGRKHAEEIKKRQNRNASFASSATEKRIELLNSFDKANYQFEVIDLNENGEPAGTKVIISLPIE